MSGSWTELRRSKLAQEPRGVRVSVPVEMEESDAIDWRLLMVQLSLCGIGRKREGLTGMLVEFCGSTLTHPVDQR